MKLEIVQLFSYDNLKMPPQDERARLLERRAKLDARLKQLAHQETKQQRKDDTRRKIIAGALSLEHAETDPAFAAALAKLLNRYVTRPQDRALFHFLDDRQPDPSPAPTDQFNAAAPALSPPIPSPDATLPASFTSAAPTPSPSPPEPL